MAALIFDQDSLGKIILPLRGRQGIEFCHKREGIILLKMLIPHAFLNISSRWHKFTWLLVNNLGNSCEGMKERGGGYIFLRVKTSL